MFFLHALATLRQKLQEDGDEEGVAALPLVTAFERASAPGGVWRSSRSSAADASNNDDTAATATNTNMYEGLWINGPSQAMEFADYTYADHFQRAMPIYIPRKSVLEYILARVTSKEDIFQHVKFETTVLYVSFDEALGKFVIVTIDNRTGETSVGHYDKCIWAAGINGKPHFASDIKDLLLEQNFKGQVVHSVEMGSLTSSVQGKRIMLIGDSFSAEDLALQCLKLGADKVYITSRHGKGIASDVVAWPGNRVEVLNGMVPCGVADDGNGIICGKFDGEEECDAEDESTVEVRDVSIVIFCTGYGPNMDFLDPELKSWWNETDKAPVFSVPDGWRMKNNSLSAILGAVKPSTELDTREHNYFIPGLYRQHVLIRNPNMMFLFEDNDFPLLNIDVSAWLLLGYITETVQVPNTAHAMERWNSQQLLRGMQEPHLRFEMDRKYRDAIHIDTNRTEQVADFFRYEIRWLAQGMKDGGYPFSLGTYDKLNDEGEKMVRMAAASDLSFRSEIEEEDSKDIEWRTFRDIDPHGFSSLITGIEAVPLAARWMDIDDEGLVQTENQSSTESLAASCERSESTLALSQCDIVPASGQLCAR